MRIATFGILVLGLPALAFAQVEPCASGQYAFDPYKPSDLAVIRQLGGSVLAQAPPSVLLRLDPYVPAQAQLLREYGGGLPVWPFAWYPAYPVPASPRDCVTVREPPPPVAMAAEPPITTVAELLIALEPARGSSAMAPSAGGAPAASADRKTGLWIDYAGRTWVSAGRAVTFDAAQFQRVGELADAPVFRRRGAQDDIIYVPTTPGVVAPFRATAR